MKFIFKNLGPIHEAEMELGDLTILAGRNNTGKTYVAYTLYGFLKTWREWPLLSEFSEELIRHSLSSYNIPSRFSHLSNVEHLAKIVIAEKQVRLSLDQEMLHSKRKPIMLEMALAFSEAVLPGMFSASDKDFENASIGIMARDKFPEYLPKKTFAVFMGNEVSFSYRNGEIRISISSPARKNLSPVDLSLALSDIYPSFLFPEFPEPFILSTERFGISLFYKELDFTKNRLVGALQEIGWGRERERLQPFLIIDKIAGRYALPIRDNIDYTRDIPYLQRHRSEIYDAKLFNEIRDMMGGSYAASGDDIRFKSKARKERRFDIPLHIASSSVRGLSDLYFFLRHVAKKNQLLIIDEPESHLDTANQIQFARLLARAVHAGLKVLITTHSDYIVKEINNLLMLSQDFEEKDEVLKELGYSKHDFLKPESVRAYVAKDKSLTRCTIDSYGINMPVFDTTIDAINRVSSELSVRLKYEGEE